VRICCCDDGVILYRWVGARDWNLCCLSVAVDIQSFGSRHDVVSFIILMPFHMLEDKVYGF